MAVDLSSNEDLQQLFLLELLVDCIKFDHKKIDLQKSVLNLLKQTCVRFSFLNFPIIEVCEEDFCPTQGNYKAADIVFKNGKSCFFSLSGLPPNTVSLKIGATIIRQKDEPPPVVIGTTCIQLDKNFVNVLNNDRNFCETTEVSKSLKDVFPIVDDKGIIIGTITLFIRLSSFGKAIITHFKIPQENEKGYLFRSNNEPEQPRGFPGPSSTPDLKTAPNKPVIPGSSILPVSGGTQKPAGTDIKTGKMNLLGKRSGKIGKNKSGTISSNAQGQRLQDSALTFLEDVPPGTAISSALGNVPEFTTGNKPGPVNRAPIEVKPFNVPVGGSGDKLGMANGNAAMVHKNIPCENQEKWIFPGNINPFQLGMEGVISGGDTGIMPGTHLGTAYGQTAGFYFNEMGMGNHPGITSYTTPQSLLALRCNVDNVINKNYKELAVSINGHEFTINVLKKTRKKEGKKSELKLCGRIPKKELCDSEESAGDESNIMIEPQKLQALEDTKEMPARPVDDVHLHEETTEIKTKFLTIPETKDKYSTQQTLSSPFKLCECDIPLPKGFRLPDSVLNKSQIQQEKNVLQSPPFTEPPNILKTASHSETFFQSNSKLGMPITNIITPATSNASFIPLKKIRKLKKEKRPKETPKTYCLQPDCPMGFTLPPNVPLQTKIIKVPCCPQLRMHPGSIGLKGSQIILQLANGQHSDLYPNRTTQDQKSPYGLQFGAANQATSKCTKMVLELPTPKLKITKVLKCDIDTQYLESDLLITDNMKPKIDDSKRQKDIKKMKKKK